MAQNQEAKLSKNLQGISLATYHKGAGTPPPEGMTWDDVIEKRCDNAARSTAKMSDYTPPEEGEEPDPEDPGDDYVPPYTQAEIDEALAVTTYPECRMHFMGLPGWIYRFFKEDPKMVRDTVYELARQVRLSGGMYLRTFMMNGSRDADERYMMDALPWMMVKVKEGGKEIKKVDFEQPNEFYYECCGIIEEACKFWKIHHQPTFYMDRYNEDIFDARFNIQGVNGYRSESALVYKCRFIYDYMDFQHNYRPDDYKHGWEIENEPFHHRNHYLGATIADQNLVMFREAERHGARIDETMTCSRYSEFSHANFVGEHYFAPLQRTFGSDEFESRKVKAEWHSVSTLDDLLYKMDWEGALGSGWKNLCNNEDGADSGSYNPVPWSPFRLADYDESVEMITYAITSSRACGKRWFFTYFMMDCLQVDPDDGIVKETYDLSKMDFERIKAYKHVRLDLDEA